MMRDRPANPAMPPAISLLRLCPGSPPEGCAGALSDRRMCLSIAACVQMGPMSVENLDRKPRAGKHDAKRWLMRAGLGDPRPSRRGLSPSRPADSDGSGPDCEREGASGHEPLNTFRPDRENVHGRRCAPMQRLQAKPIPRIGRAVFYPFPIFRPVRRVSCGGTPSLKTETAVQSP